MLLRAGKKSKLSLLFSFFPRFFSLILLIILAAVTYQRNEIWRSPLNLWADTTSKSPCKSRPFNSLGTVYANQGAYDAAIEAFQIAINNGSGSQEIHYLNIALAYERLGRFQESIHAIQKAIAIKADYAKAHYHLGFIYRNTGALELAALEFIKALSIVPANDAYHNDLGNVYLLQKKYDLSCEQYKKSLRINPSNMESLFNLALSLDESGDKHLAKMYYRQFIEKASAEYEFAIIKAQQRILVLEQDF